MLALFFRKRCYFSMVALNAEQRIVGLVCLNDYPNVPALYPSEWETWVQNLYRLEKKKFKCDINIL